MLAVVAKPLRDAQSRLLLTAIKRRGKTAVPNPPTTRALLDTLVIGEPHYFGEKWERGYSPQWYRASAAKLPLYRYSSVKECPDGGYFFELSGLIYSSHKGFSRSLRAKNLLLTRFRVTMSYENLVVGPGCAVGYVMLCGRHTYGIGGALGDFMGGPMFSRGNGIVSLTWLQYVQEQEGDNEDRMLVEDVTPDTRYVVEAVFQHESVTSCFGTVDISVNGQTVVQGLRVVYKPLSSIQLYNTSDGTARIGGIEIWSEKAAPDQVWERED